MIDGGLAVWLFTVADVLAAIAVTIHVLLRKQDVRAAIGWIGIAWLSPIVGCVLYWLFGINRVSRRAARLKRNFYKASLAGSDTGTSAAPPPHLAAISAVAARASGRPLVAGNAIQPLSGAQTAYPRMLSVIAGARHSVALASYIFRADAAGQRFIEALAEAQTRGCVVRVLLDGVGGGYVWSRAFHRLRRQGVPVARFLRDWIPWRMPLVNLRNHRKLLIVDGDTAFTGGLNIGSENLSVGGKGDPLVNDLHFEVTGPVVAQMMAVFEQDWEFTTGESLSGVPWSSRVGNVGPALARAITEGPDDDCDTLEMLLVAAINAAQKRIRIVTPYFLPDQRLLFALTLAAFRGVQVEIIVPERSNYRTLDWAARVQLADLASAGCRIFFSPQPFDHTKVMTVDEAWALIGSANWDERSLRLNFELNVEAYDGALAAWLDAIIDVKIKRARHVSDDEFASTPLPLRLRNATCRLLLPYL